MPDPRKPRTDDAPRIGFRTTDDVRQMIDDYCDEHGCSITWLIERALREYIGKEKKS